MVTDICMTTRNRIEYLKETINRLFACTHSPFALHIIDDNSDLQILDYLVDLWKDGKLASLIMRGEHVGHMPNENLATWITFSDPFVLTMDDLLCPMVKPDWIERGRKAILARPGLAELDLNHPGAPHGPAYEQDELVTYCEAVGGTFAFIRRVFAEQFHFDHTRGNFGLVDDLVRCSRAYAAGFRVGFLTDTFCYHIGKWSELCQCESGFPDVPVLNWDTLEPPQEFIWRKPEGWKPPIL